MSQSNLTMTSTVTLATGIAMPRFGLGVWSSKPGDETYLAVRRALDAGYRLIDTAEGYSNEADVGRAVKDSGICREEIFITTKLAKGSMGLPKAADSFKRSQDALGRIDLYLIHWPNPGTRTESWQYLETLLADGKVRSIGVSNYTVRHLEELTQTARTMPVMNQVELSPFLNQVPLRAWCRDRQIQVTAYSPLTRGEKLNHPVVTDIARKHGKSNAQILIRWCLESDLVVIPKSVQEDRIRENGNVFDFELDPTDRTRLDGLHENFRCVATWNPELEK